MTEFLAEVASLYAQIALLVILLGFAVLTLFGKARQTPLGRRFLEYVGNVDVPETGTSRRQHTDSKPQRSSA